MTFKKKNIKGFTLIELVIVFVIIGILVVNAVMAHGKFVKEAMISEGKMLVSSIAKIEKLYNTEVGNYVEILNASYTEMPQMDSRYNKYFKTFSVYVPGTVPDSAFTIVTTSEINILSGVEITLHVFENKPNEMTVTDIGLIGNNNDGDNNNEGGGQGNNNGNNGNGNGNNENGNNNNGNGGNNNDGDDNNQGGGQENNNGNNDNGNGKNGN